MKEVYFDNCALQRPLDPLLNVRIKVEAEAMLGLIEWIEGGQLALVTSTVLEFELRMTPDPERVLVAEQILHFAQRRVEWSDEVKQQAQVFERAGLRAIDALHLAIAHLEKIDCFCTCDDRLLKAARRLAGLQPTVLLPTDLIHILAP